MLKIIAFVSILGGIVLIYAHDGALSGSSLGVVLALAGELGYALFIFFAKSLSIGSGLPHLVWLFGFRSFYLLIPMTRGPLAVPPVDAVFLFSEVLTPIGWVGATAIMARLLLALKRDTWLGKEAKIMT